jgi:hypothetical protein
MLHLSAMKVVITRSVKQDNHGNIYFIGLDTAAACFRQAIRDFYLDRCDHARVEHLAVDN